MFDDILDQAIQRVERVQKSPDILSNFPFVFVNPMMGCLKGGGEQFRQVDQSYRAQDRKISSALQRDKWDVFRNLMIVRDRVTHNKILPIDCYTKSYRYGRGERLIIQAFV